MLMTSHRAFSVFSYIYLLQIVKSVEAAAQGQSPEIVEECEKSVCNIL